MLALLLFSFMESTPWAFVAPSTVQDLVCGLLEVFGTVHLCRTYCLVEEMKLAQHGNKETWVLVSLWLSSDTVACISIVCVVFALQEA